jgi:hypothetical protein
MSATPQKGSRLRGEIAHSIRRTGLRGADIKQGAGGKKEFIEPEISQPVDVLEATTFFQAIDSGPTG